MAPILIDNRGLIKFGLISVLTTVIVFTGGFFSGYQQASTFYAGGSQVETLALPVSAVLLDSDVEPHLPDMIAAGADIDVDQPQLESKASAKISAVESRLSTSSNKEKTNKTKVAPTLNKLASLERASIEETSKSSNKVASDDKNIIYNNNQFSTKESIKETANPDSSQNESAAIKEPDFLVVTSLTSAELKSIKYSVQVGMYGRLINAENMMRMLQAKRLDAYVSHYTSKKNEIRYNVRFGYFADKKSAKIALKNYKNKLQGDGYLVNFSVESITKLADAMDLKQPTTTEKTKKELLPATTPLETTGDKVSQADIVSAATV